MAGHDPSGGRFPGASRPIKDHVHDILIVQHSLEPLNAILRYGQVSEVPRTQHLREQFLVTGHWLNRLSGLRRDL
jgi:hypothetical protein